MGNGSESGDQSVQDAPATGVNITLQTVTNDGMGVSTPGSVSCSPNRMHRVKRIRFKDHLDVVLLKSIIAVKTHVSERGTSQHKFEEAVAVFI